MLKNGELIKTDHKMCLHELREKAIFEFLSYFEKDNEKLQ